MNKSKVKSKRRKASILEDGVDLISNLPDHVLPLILSRLSSTKESIRTSILSRRWRYAWTSIPSLDLDYHGGRELSETSKFKNVVDRGLLHRSVDLESFRLACSNYFSWSTLERWIHATVMRNVKQLYLRFWPDEDMVMPHCLVTCASLEVLKLCLGRRLIVPSCSGFPALRVLKLENVEISEDGIVKYFLDGCPLLEDLTLEDCGLGKLDVLCISSPKLKKLRFLHRANDDSCRCLKLLCPKLVFLEIKCLVALNYIFEGLYSLKEVVIDASYEVISRVLHKISHVESLRTNLFFLYECINAARDPALPNLKTLELNNTINAGFTVKALNQILKISPKLESLRLTVLHVYKYEEVKEDYDETEYPKLDGVGTWNLTPDVAWVEFFELKGEKPNLSIFWRDKNKSDWVSLTAKWGNEAR